MRITRDILRVVAAVTLCLLVASQAPLVHGQSREEVVLWESIKNSNDVADFQGYLDKYPDGTFATVARRKIEAISRANPKSLAGSTWNVKLDWNGRYGGIVAESPDNTNKWHHSSSGEAISFGEDGSCTETASVWANQPCRWVKQGQIVTVTLGLDDPKTNSCFESWSLTIDGESMSGKKTLFCGKKSKDSQASYCLTMTVRPQ